jgi:acyl carrier protein
MSSATEDRVIAVFRLVFKNRGLEPPELGPATVLDSSLGLESLDFAEVVVRLEREFGTDPFADGVPPGTRTVADVARLYD